MKVLLCGYHEAGFRALRVLIARKHDLFVATHPCPPELPSLSALARSVGARAIEGDVDEVYHNARSFGPDLILSVYYRSILPTTILNLAPRGAYNFHPALLPKHRGSFSAPWAIIDGDSATGVTCHRMIERVDAGDIVDTQPVPIAEDDVGITLYYKLVDATVSLVDRVISKLERGPVDSIPQSGAGSFHRRRRPRNGVIDHTWPRDRVDRFIRALYFPPYPPAAIIIDGTKHAVRNISEYDEVVATQVAPSARA